MKKLFMALLVIGLSLGCGKDDPCENITCVNGFCANGDCNCDEGWTGSDCSVKKTPDYMLIKKVVVTKFPATEDNGGGPAWGTRPM
ncbi:MAG: hypothetical protein DHS20C13_25350 [Thermodesulfobacteriota bacterium]|nr:MAG: hypothetical protein DHS20C13_25350 [Thermodesulfobacteriota bacterium]GJM36342.1 MAG: hypothetical protein DHS20C18_53430 [Saprospiraceae bacterium]